ncbi:MAG: proprotein convertase P-domain-containing protein [Myxococcales bacterium]|nr:proprotein convertase P-domain-containing protein [Myxococcales bacterium]
MQFLPTGIGASSIFVALVLVLGAQPSAADSLVATRSQPVREIAHNVAISVDGGIATYRVRRTFANAGKVTDQVYLEIDLPYGAAATGLRIRAHDRWYDGELMAAEKAEALYRELTGLGPHRPKDPAWLYWLWTDKLGLQIFPVLAGQTSTVEYTLTAPTRYQNGRMVVFYPRTEAATETDEEADEEAEETDAAGTATNESAAPSLFAKLFSAAARQRIAQLCARGGCALSSPTGATMVADLSEGIAPGELLGGLGTAGTNDALQTDFPADPLRVSKLANPVITVKPSWGDAATLLRVDGNRFSVDTPFILTIPDVPPWQREHADELEASAGYVASVISVAPTRQTQQLATEVTLVVDIEHTWRGDIRLQLLTPTGELLDVVGEADQPWGGRENDLRMSQVISLPEPMPAAGTWRLIVSDHVPTDAGVLRAWSLRFGPGNTAAQASATDTPLFIQDAPYNPDDSGVATIEIAAPTIDIVAGRLGRVDVIADKQIARFELDTAAELLPAPKGAHVVFAVDASHSQQAKGIAAQLRLIKAYASHLPDASFEIVSYRRRASRVFGKWQPAATVAIALDKAVAAGGFAPGNGSALDAAATLATEILRGDTAPTRLVFLTDDLLRPGFHNRDALAALAGLPPRAIVHVATVKLDESADEVTFVRDDTLPRGVLATRHRGIAVTLDGLGGSGEKRLGAVALHLVRPTQIDNFRVVGWPEVDGDNEEIPDSLKEGTGLRLMGIAGNAAPTRVQLRGKIWSDDFTRTVTVNQRFSIATAGWLFSEDEYGEFSDEEQYKVAMYGRAVSPVTSYLAIEPGTRPSYDGFEHAGIGLGGFGAAGFGAGGDGARGIRRQAPDLRALIDTAACRKVARGPADKVTLVIDTTFAEIVDVRAHANSGGSPAFYACVVEATWAAVLDQRFDLEREAYEVEFAAEDAP